MARTYTVKKGDTLSEIAQKYSTTVNELAKLNKISDPDYIYVGQVLKLEGSTAVEKVVLSKAKITNLQYQTGSDRTIFAVWTWDKENTDNYQIEWYYSTGDDVWFIASSSSVDVKQSTYGAPENAKTIKFKVKPISKTKKVDNKDVYFWDAGWSEKSFSMDKIPPKAPPTPNVSVNEEGTKLTASLSGLGNLDASIIQFDVAKNNSPSYKSARISITKTDTASWECALGGGAEYKVRCRAIKNDLNSDWSAWSPGVMSRAELPSDFAIKECKIVDGEPLKLVVSWPQIGETLVDKAAQYKVEYTTVKSDFSSDTPTHLQSLTSFNTKCEITSNIQPDTVYYVRVTYRNVSSASEGDIANGLWADTWSPIRSTAIDSALGSPTTWSSVSTAKVGDVVTLHWTHNSESGAKDQYADIEMYVTDGEGNVTQRVPPTLEFTKDDGTLDEDANREYNVDTSEYDEGARIRWRVRTACATGEFSDWPIMRVILVYSEPTLEFNSQDIVFDEERNYHFLSSFPIRMNALAGPDAQNAIGYRITITSNEDYTSVDNLGDACLIRYGDVVYSKFFDSVNEDTRNDFAYSLSAGEVSLDPNISYHISCEVTMDSGLTAEKSIDFLTEWTEESYDVNAEIGISKDDYSALIRPYCLDKSRKLVPNVFLHVYRREPDGKFTLIAADVPNDGTTYVTDPHPALDYARYRITARDDKTQAIYYIDLPSHYVGCKHAIIQWDERWTTFDASGDGGSDKPWVGSMLVLKYNIDVTDKNKPDVSLVEYIGREHPVSYYGTQLGTSSNWNVVIDKNDIETIYHLRRLSTWMGNVYVREPFGTGYWANVSVSFSRKHLDPTIPVTITITRVEGGM